MKNVLLYSWVDVLLVQLIEKRYNIIILLLNNTILEEEENIYNNVQRLVYYKCEFL